MGSCKILDCTLRDGGYVNNWEFGKVNSMNIIRLLSKAKVDYIEIGFFSNKENQDSQTLFNSFNKADTFIPDEIENSKIVGMITYGDFEQEKIPECKETKVKNLRVIFKKSQSDAAIQYCKELIKKGYNVFVNPTFINMFTDLEIIELLSKINDIHPYGASIVDSMGVLNESETLRLFYLFNHNLNDDILLCFHSHNNLQLSLSNAKSLVNATKYRPLIIDSTVFGIGRGAGNLCTELIIQYLNKNEQKYELLPVLKIIDEYINPIYSLTPWGYSVPYYLAAINDCHPNYAKYLDEKHSLPVEKINALLKQLPIENRYVYDKELIKKIYLNSQEVFIDESISLKTFRRELNNRKILIIGPGRSITNFYKEISNFIKLNEPIVISLNFIPNLIEVNFAFFSNQKRYLQLCNSKDISKYKLILSSNINCKHNEKNVLVVNYSSYVNNSSAFDNASLMIFNLLKSINVNEIYLAGLDGFSKNSNENFYDTELVNTSNDETFEEKNRAIKSELYQLSKSIHFIFITPSLYSDFGEQKC